MINNLVDFRNTLVNKFGPVLGYVILAICALAVLSVLGFLIKAAFGIIVWLAVASVVLFGGYKLYQLITSRKGA